VRKVTSDAGRWTSARERRRGARFVVVLEEPGHAVLDVDLGPEVVTHGAGVSVPEPVVEPLVVGDVEALLLQLPLEVPVDLGHQHHRRVPVAQPGDRRRPERLGAAAPGPLEDVRQDQHGHVAADAVAPVGDREQGVGHRLLDRGSRVVELQGVGPAVEVRVAAVGEDAATEAGEVLRPAREVLLGPLDEELGVLVDPGVVERDVVGHEVEHQPQPAPRQPRAQPGHGGSPPSSGWTS
jgi:hypothetical protein